MLNIHLGDANQNHNESSPHTHQNGYKNNQRQTITRIEGMETLESSYSAGGQSNRAAA